MKWLLIDKKGDEVKLPKIVKDFRDEDALIHSFTPPRHSASTGRVNTDMGCFFPSVFDLEIVECIEVPE